MNRDEFDNYTGLRCIFCGEAEVVGLLEVWDGHEFMLDTCCEALHEAILDDMQDDPEYSAELLRRLGVEVVMGAQLRRVAACVEGYRLDCKLEIRLIEQADAKEFVRQHHRHCKPPAGWRFGAGIWNAWTLIGVVMVGRPVARGFDPSCVIEVNRLCVRTDVPRELAWNACSQLYGWAAREAAKRGFERVITYTLQSEPGTTLIVAG